MRRWLAGLLCILLLSGCGGNTAEEDGYDLYFQERDLRAAAGGGVLRTETVQLQEESTEQMARALMEALLAGPSDETLKSTIPAGTSLLSLELNGSRAVVDLSSPYQTLSGISLTLADQAVALTLTQLPDILSVQITVRGQELAYRGRQIFTGRDVLLAPEGDVVGTAEVTLYFPDESGELQPEERSLDLYEGDTLLDAVVQALEGGPLDEDLSAAFPAGFRPRAVWQEGEICYVNLSSGLLPELPEDGSVDTALSALAWSLCALDTVEETRFLVDGEFAAYYGDTDVSQPFHE